MVEFEIYILIHKPVEMVLQAFLNLENMPYYTTDLERIEVIKDEPELVGSVLHLHYRKKGRSYVMEDKLEYCEPGKIYISRVTGDVLSAIVEISFDASDPGKTKMNLSWSGQGKVLFLRLFLPLIRGRIKRQARIELEKFKELVETFGVDFRESQYVST